MLIKQYINNQSYLLHNRIFFLVGSYLDDKDGAEVNL